MFDIQSCVKVLSHPNSFVFDFYFVLSSPEFLKGQCYSLDISCYFTHFPSSPCGRLFSEEGFGVLSSVTLTYESLKLQKGT